MVFSSLIFTFFFLPLVLFLYFLAKDKYRNYVLLAASLLFYTYGEPKFVFVMAASICINYVVALAIHCHNEKSSFHMARNLLILAAVLNLGILFVFKYLDFSISLVNRAFGTSLPAQNIALPIGISFFTFQALSYVIDVYRGSVAVQKNPLYLALYISFFPQLIAGPIVRYSTIEQQITDRSCTLERFGNGIQRFFLGFCKKVLLSNNLSVVSAAVFGMADNITSVNPLLLWIGSVSYSLQIFYDFSGYSDMAIGLGKMFGFEFEENFNYPYISRSVTEFWRRWHISLGQWFRDYVYFPMGGSRVAVSRHLFNMFLVWSLTGIWHGANLTFIAWGLGYFILLVIEKYLIKPEQRQSAFLHILWQAVTLLCVNFGWVIFNSKGIRNGIKFCLAMTGFYSTAAEIDSMVLYYCREYGFFFIAGILFSTPVAKLLANQIDKNKQAGNIRAVLCPICYAIGFLWAVSFLVLGAHNPFIYFNF